MIFNLYRILLSVFLLFPLLISIAFFTLAERKIMAAIQRRRGPNIVGIWGILQPIADGLKLLIKEVILPYHVNKILFLLAPILTFSISFLNWGLIPFTYSDIILDLNYSLLYLYAFSSLSIYGIIIAGWISQSKYPFFGAIRAAAQMISYEVSIGFVFVIISFCTHSINLIDIVYWQEVNIWFIFLILPISVVFYISLIAETNRAPFDLPEAEAEIVAGYNLEYSSLIFALFFLGEYGNIFLMSIIFSLLFLGGWTFFFYNSWIILIFKSLLSCFFFILIRATLPRYRFDQLIMCNWQIFLPISFFYFVFLIVLYLLIFY
jgi:NADH-quinone oxidoreductase subunit H